MSDVFVLNKEKNVIYNVIYKLTERQKLIIELIESDVTISATEMAQRLTATSRTIQRDIAELQKMEVLKRE